MISDSARHELLKFDMSENFSIRFLNSLALKNTVTFPFQSAFGMSKFCCLCRIT
jgi:hypothetical protein